MSNVSRILDRVQQGEAKAAEELLWLGYEELRKLAAAVMAHEAPGKPSGSWPSFARPACGL